MCPTRLLLLIMVCISGMKVNANSDSLTDLPKVSVGVLKYGTVNWEIAVIKHYQLDKKYNFDLQVMPLSNKNASAVALQSKAVDIILGDWLWVNRQRFNGKSYTLVPTSIASGGVYVNGESTGKSLHDLTKSKIGVAGGAVDKNWLLLQAYAQKKYKLNIKENAEIVQAILAGKGQEAHNSAVIINCAALLYLHREQLNGKADTLLLAAQHAALVLSSGVAAKTLADLVRLSNSGASAS